MKRTTGKDEFPQVLDDCLSRIQRGEATIQECLRAFPEHAEVLEALLQVSVEVTDALKPSPPTESFRQTSRIRLENRIRARLKGTSPEKKVEQQERAGGLRLGGLLRPAFVLASLALVVAMVLTTTGVAYASSSSLPGDLLYPVKRGVEEARLVVTRTPSAELRLVESYVDARVREIQDLLGEERQDDLSIGVDQYESMLDRLVELSGNPELEQEELFRVQVTLNQQLGVLEGVLEESPGSAREGINRALTRSQQGVMVIESLLGVENPSELAPGQEKKETQGTEGEDPPGPEPNPGSNLQVERTAAQIANQYQVEVEAVLGLYHGDCEEDWRCVREYYREQQRKQQQLEQDQRTAARLARQYQVSEEHVWSLFTGSCERDWPCVRKVLRGDSKPDKPGKP